MTILQAEALTVHRGGKAVVDGVSLAIRPGEVTAIIGPNGAGKSSLMHALAGLERAEAGAVLLDGKSLHQLAPRFRAQVIGYLPQQPDIHWAMPVQDIVALGRLPHRGPLAGMSPADHDAVAHAMRSADVEVLAQRPVNSLSGGERARVLLARVLAGQPDIILADEPLANLDPLHQSELLRVFRRLADEGRAVGLVLHDLTAAARVADRALLLDKGRTKALGGAIDVLDPVVLEPVFGLALEQIHGAGGMALLPRGMLR